MINKYQNNWQKINEKVYFNLTYYFPCKMQELI